MTKDRVLSIALVLVIIVFFIETFNIPAKAASQTFSSAFYPRILLGILSVLTIIQLVKSFLPKKEEEKSTTNKKNEKTSLTAYGYVFALFAVTALYIFLLKITGFLIASCIYLIIAQVILIGINKKKVLLISISSSLVIAFAVQFIFTNYLNILLP